MADRLFSPGTTVSSTNKTDHHNITEIVLKVALSTIINQSTMVLLFMGELSPLKQLLYWRCLLYVDSDTINV